MDNKVTLMDNKQGCTASPSDASAECANAETRRKN